MATTEGVVQLPLDGTGKKLRAQTGGDMPAGTFAEVLVLQDTLGDLVDPADKTSVINITTSLGSDGTGAPANPGTGVRGWLRGAYEKLEAIRAAVTGTLTVGGTVAVSSLPEVEVKNDTGNPLTVAVSSLPEVEVKNDTGNPLVVKDDFLTGECLADQPGAGAVLTFTFSAPVQGFWVVDTSGQTSAISRVDPFGGTPSTTQGFPVFNGQATPFYVTCTTIKVYAPAGTTISVTGFRR